jgi:hypothetical protein
MPINSWSSTDVDLAVSDDRIQFDASLLGAVLENAVIFGSADNSLTASDLNVIVPSNSDSIETTSVRDMIRAGTCLWDAIIAKGLSDNSEVNITYQTGADVDYTDSDIAHMLFTSFFFILTQDIHFGQNTHSPKILTEVLGLKINPTDYKFGYSSFKATKVPKEWVKTIKMTNLGQKVQNRLALGTAGYRQMAACQVIELVPSAPASAKAAHAAICANVSAGLFWDFHPAFRSASFVQKFGSLNKTIASLLAKYGVPADIENAVSNKSLFAAPIFDSRHSAFGNLTTANFGLFHISKIFT